MNELEKIFFSPNWLTPFTWGNDLSERYDLVEKPEFKKRRLEATRDSLKARIKSHEERIVELREEEKKVKKDLENLK